MPNMLSEYFGGGIEAFEKLILGLQSYNKGFDELEATRAKIRQKILALGVSKRSARELTKPKIRREAFDAKSAMKPIADAYGPERVAHFSHYIERAQKANYKFKPSDVIDLMQMMYICECDLFRCDKAMSDLFKDYPPFDGKLVKRFEDLPARIEAEIG